MILSSLVTKRQKASVIICPHPVCSEYIVELEERNPLVDLLISHLKTMHNVSPTEYFIERITYKISFIRKLKCAYTDPFIYVTWEELFSEGML